MTEELPVKVTDEQLGIHAGQSTSEAVELDLGSLYAFDPSAASTTDETTVKGFATTLTQAIFNALMELPSEIGPTGRGVSLPAPTSKLPRAKPIPQPRLPTKWEQFAQRKGIQKRKRSSLAFDEGQQTWKRRYGYDRANPGEVANPIMMAKPSDKVGEDPFTGAAAKKRKGVEQNRERQINNMKADRKAALGGRSAVPASVKLAATLPEHGRGRPQKRQEMDSAIHASAVRASKSTASMGKFDKKPAGATGATIAKAAVVRQKAKPVASKTGAEKAAQHSTIDRLLRENS